MPLTFIDANVLISASRGEAPAAERALDILDDPSREFASSAFLCLEILPKPIYERRQPEVDFYEKFFDAVAHWAAPNPELVDAAFEVAKSHGLAAMDALHVAAAESLGVVEFVTGELSSKPMFRVTSMRMRSIQSDLP